MTVGVTAYRRGGWLGVAVALAAIGACEGKPEESTSPPAAPAASTDPCAVGRRVDPPPGVLEPARVAFERQDYAKAQQLLDPLIAAHPNSATLRLLRAEAVLYSAKRAEGEEQYVAAAGRALPGFSEAADLHARGCLLAEREQYYLLMDMAYAHLRRRDAAAARRPLQRARERWPTSGEVTYHLARTFCLDADVDECAQLFETTLSIARALQRPRFLRTYHSVDDWIRRSRSQSEFGPLRRDPRYAKIISEARR